MNVAAALHRLVNPVAVKEMRAAFRGNRYLIAHMIIVALAALGMFLFLLMLTLNFENSQWRIDSSYIGQWAMHASQIVHGCIVLLVVPAFAATAISTERERETLDLMLATGLRARTIVIGKFLSAMGLTGLLFVALMPIVALCFLFGGVSVYQILANYALLALLAALLIIVALAISAASPGTARAVITTYVAAMVLGSLVVGLWTSVVLGTSFGRPQLEAYGVFTAEEMAVFNTREIPAAGDFGPFQIAVGAYLVPAYLWFTAAGFFLLLAINRLKPTFANQSTGMRVYYAIVAVLLAGAVIPLTASAFDADVRPAGNGAGAAIMLMLILGTVSCMFAIESPFLPPHQRHLLERAQRRGWHLWIFHPGSRTGVAFVMAVNGVALLLLAAWWIGLGGAQEAAHVYAFGAAVGVLGVWLWFACGLAALLSGWADRCPLAARIVFVIAIALLCVLPAIDATMEQVMVERHEEPPEHVAVSTVLSPVVTVFTALELPEGDRRSTTFKLFLPGEIYQPVGFCLVIGPLGFLFNVLAARRYWRRVNLEAREAAVERGEV